MVKLVADWRDAHKFLSVIAAGVGGVAYAVVEVAKEVKSLDIELPDGSNTFVFYATIASVVAGRLIKQFDYD